MNRRRLVQLMLCVPPLSSLLAACDRSEDAAPPATAPVVEEPDSALPDAPPEFTNLKVLPEEITRKDLLATMKGITKSLGVRCNFCHRTDTRDYASDEIREKTVAREMLRMVERINREQFTWKDAPTATCFMCHHGEKEPRLDP